MVLFVMLMIFGCANTEKSDPVEVMYFILIDRFVDGDSTNNTGHDPESYQAYNGHNPEALKYYQGGDLVGITQSLERLKNMGLSMIWLSPFLDNSNTDYVGWWPYHGYHPIDFYEIDEHFGTLKDLKTLVSTAHALGMKIIFDMPFNQTAADHPWVNQASKVDWYHMDEDGDPFEITDWQDQVQIEIGELHGLPDLAQENPEVSKYLWEVSKYWIEETGCDGFRLDAVKHVPLSFWKGYTEQIREFAGSDFLLFGEVFWGEAEKILPYESVGFDYLFDIPGYYAIRNTFNKGASIKGFSKFYETNSTLLGKTKFATLIDNHDVARFNVGLLEDAWDKQLLALGWLMTSPGLPVIYSGTEIGMTGYEALNQAGESQDFLNRLPYPETLSVEQTQRMAQFAELSQLRHQFPVLSDGIFREVYKDWSSYCYLRSRGLEQLLICLNNASTSESLHMKSPFSENTGYFDPIFGSGVMRVDIDELHLNVPPNSISIWRFEASVDPSLPERALFTDRLSADFQKIIVFYYDKFANIENLQVAGDFNNWQPTDYDSWRSGDTIYVEIPLKPGEYSYKMIINESEWIPDPNAADYSIDPFGGRNSTVKVES